MLEKVVGTREVIRHISKHRNPDGSFDIEGNMKIWNDVIAQFEQIRLWEQGAPGFDEALTPLQPQPSIIFVPVEEGTQGKGTIIVAHGGGFETRTGCEGIHVGHYFHKAGFNVAILTYRLKPYTRRDCIADMQRAIRLLRSIKEELGISEKIAVMGFSAGAMLSGNCATHYDMGNPGAADVIEQYSCRPDAVVMGYGAFTDVSYPTGIFVNPFTDKDRAEKYYLAPEKNVTTETPPFFIWQTNSDDPRNAFILGKALTDAGVEFELHCFPDGVHGLALADGSNDLSESIPHLAHWSELCSEWLEKYI